MNKQLLHITAEIILTIFIFAFLHSEFGFLVPQNDSHKTHDFCQLVDGTTDQVQQQESNIFYSPKIDKDICRHCFDIEISSIGKVLSARIDINLLEHTLTGDVYLQNNAFLI